MPQDTQPARFTEEELLSYIQGTATQPLMQAIDAARQTDAVLAAELEMMAALPAALEAASTPNPAGEFGWHRLEAELKRTPQLPPNVAPARTALWRAAAVVLGVLAVGQAAYLVTSPSGVAPGYVTVSDSVAEHVLAVAFAPEARMDDVTTLLREIGGRLVDGPGATGLYRIAFDDVSAWQAGRDALKAAPGIALVLEE